MTIRNVNFIIFSVLFLASQAFAYTLTGRVTVNASGAGVPNVIVEAVNYGPNSAAFRATALTSSNGAYTISGLPSDRRLEVRVVKSCYNYTNGSGPYITSTGLSGTVTQNFYFDFAGCKLQGLVNSTTNQPVQSVSVSVRSLSGPNFSATAVTDQSGLYVISGFHPDTQAQITLSKSGFTFIPNPLVISIYGDVTQNFRAEPIAPPSDCKGVPGGTNVLDRCGVCGGDGKSCLGCSTLNIFALQNDLDGTSLDQYNTVRGSIRRLKKLSKPTKFIKKVKAEGERLYMANWHLAFSVPSNMQSCTNSSFCVQVSTVAGTTQYNNNALALQNLNKEVNAKIKEINGHLRKGDKNSAKKADALYQKNTSLSAQVPKSNSVCS